jgi:hypothetical protein
MSVSGQSLASAIVKQLDHDPPDNIDPHPKLFSDLSDGERVHTQLFKLWEIGVVNAEWDEDAQGTNWNLSHFGVELHEKGLARPYIEIMEAERQVKGGPETIAGDLHRDSSDGGGE